MLSRLAKALVPISHRLPQLNEMLSANDVGNEVLGATDVGNEMLSANDVGHSEVLSVSLLKMYST